VGFGAVFVDFLTRWCLASGPPFDVPGTIQRMCTRYKWTPLYQVHSSTNVPGTPKGTTKK
jgi:hypothetical protein